MGAENNFICLVWGRIYEILSMAYIIWKWIGGDQF